MIYRIDYLNNLGKPAIKIFKTKVQAERYHDQLLAAGLPFVITSWERDKPLGKPDRTLQVQDIIEEAS